MRSHGHEGHDHVRVEAPMVDGKPDLKHAALYGMVVEYEPKCGIIEVRR